MYITIGTQGGFFMNRLVSILTLYALFSTSAAIATVENSTISLVERMECIENIPCNKLTKNQLGEITSSLKKRDEKIRVVTYNMLFNIKDDTLAKEHRWPNRLPRILELIEAMQPDIISTQELYPSQVDDIVEQLRDEFAFFPGMGTENAESYGIFYRKDRFEPIKCQFIYPVAFLQLKDRKTDKVLSLFNTHMPYSNIEKREAHAEMIVKMIQPIAQEMPTIFTGDLNTFPIRLDLTGLPFYDGDHIHRIFAKSGLRNSHELSLLGHFGPIGSFTNRDPDIAPFRGTGTPGIILDYIYVSPDTIRVLAHAIEQATVNGHYPSDHLPVVTDLLIQ